MVTSKKGDTLHKPSADPVYLTQCQTLLLCQSVKLLTHRRLERKEVSLRVDFGAWVSTSITREHAIAGSCVPTSSDSMRSWISAQAVPPEARISMWRFTSSTECCGKDGTSTQPRRSPHAKTRRSRRHHHHGAPARRTLRPSRISNNRFVSCNRDRSALSPSSMHSVASCQASQASRIRSAAEQAAPLQTQRHHPNDAPTGGPISSRRTTGAPGRAPRLVSGGMRSPQPTPRLWRAACVVDDAIRREPSDRHHWSTAPLGCVASNFLVHDFHCRSAL